jgi:hypothetical protein
VERERLTTCAQTRLLANALPWAALAGPAELARFTSGLLESGSLADVERVVEQLGSGVDALPESSAFLARFGQVHRLLAASEKALARGEPGWVLSRDRAVAECAALAESGAVPRRLLGDLLRRVLLFGLDQARVQSNPVRISVGDSLKLMRVVDGLGDAALPAGKLAMDELRAVLLAGLVGGVVEDRWGNNDRF